MARTHTQLFQTLLNLDQKGYKAYQSIQGTYSFPDFTLHIDRVQGDPFASPSQCRVQIPQHIADFPPELYGGASRSIALRDYLTRQFARGTQEFEHRRGSGRSGMIAIAPTSQAILDRTAAFVDPDQVEIRFVVGLPGFGRRIAGQQAASMLCEDLPDLVVQSLLYQNLDRTAIQHHVEVAEDGDWLRQQLARHHLVAFIADGAILPRRSGVDDRPLTDRPLPFQTPDSLRVEFDRPNQGKVTGMGIPAGITLIVGGGYHGKSTLLGAIEVGVYNHIPGDGRELVVTDPTAMKIRAEDGRSISGVNISPFISQLPQGRSTTQFSTPNASGSTSQAANIIESLEAGARVLLVDEDTAATNFMIRDRRMQALITKDREPITPFIDKVRQLYTDHGVSTILVMGGSGDYFDIADTVIAMENFHHKEVTAQAKKIAAQYCTQRASEGGEAFGQPTPRMPQVGSLDSSRGKRSVSVKVRDTDTLSFGQFDIDVAAVEQVKEAGQLRAMGAAMVTLQQHYLDGQLSLQDLLDCIMKDMEHPGLDKFTRLPEGDLVKFRRLELAAVINRLRSLKIS